MIATDVQFKGVNGVGVIELALEEGQQVYTLIGENGVGKTKTLEALFQTLLCRHEGFIKSRGNYSIPWAFSEAYFSKFSFFVGKEQSISSVLLNQRNNDSIIPEHNTPIVFLASQNRGFIKEHKRNQMIQTLGTLDDRRSKYFERLYEGMMEGFSSLNMDAGIEEWFVQLGQSANRFQKQEDNREIEITTVLKLLHQIDQRIDPNYMQIIGGGSVALMVDQNERQLSHLSTGFVSILKIIQAIVSGYGYFTNEAQLDKVRGIVLIDEIESHLHVAWQVRIIKLLKSLFPNTTFYITTHSSLVLSQLEAHEAYRLSRADDGVVRTKEIDAPDKAALIDLLKDGFGVDLNEIKLDNLLPEQQEDVKEQLLQLIMDNASEIRPAS